MRAVAVILIVGGWFAGCGRDDIHRGGDGEAWPIDPENVAPACAVYSGCMQRSGISGCVMFLNVRGHFDPETMPFLPEEPEYILDWPTAASVAQNIKCVLLAGADCERFFTCLNRGPAVHGCEYVNERRCLDENILTACIGVGEHSSPPRDTVEISTRCDELGLNCVEIDYPDGTTSAACMYKSDVFVPGAEVACYGSVASVQVGYGIIVYDCAVETGGCLPGTYADLGDIARRKFCDVPVCDDATYERRCEGDTLRDCSQGREANVVCGVLDLVCREVQSEPVCTYSSCAPLHMEEECENGVVTYCGPDGEVKISCTELGFSGCQRGARCAM